MVKVSLFAASINPHNWSSLLDSLKSNKIEYEVIMCGFIDEYLCKEASEGYSEFRYIQSENVKVAQCYEVARRACTGDLIGWISDDCIFSEGALDKIYEFWSKCNNPMPVIAVKNVDKDCVNNDLNDQRFYSRNLNTPQMAQIGFMSRLLLENIGGLDNRYIYGKWESDICMRVLAKGGKVYRFEDSYVDIEHTNKNGHINNDWSGINEDGEVLEGSWVVGGYKGIPKGILLYKNTPEFYFPITNNEVTLERSDKFQPYTDEDLLIKSQGLNIAGRWV